MSNTVEPFAHLGAWHHDVQVTETVRTSALSVPYDGKNFTSKKYLKEALLKLYGEQLKNKTVLDVACNAGGHLFELQSLGIKAGLGFDVRQSWIDQALWLKRNVNLYNTDNLEFQCSDIKLLASLEHFDITLFNGIFYHLADPVHHLLKACEITNETIVINTAYSVHFESRSIDGLQFKMESKEMEHGLSGVEGISWLPTENVLKRILNSAGFKNIKCLFKNKDAGRLCLVAQRN